MAPQVVNSCQGQLVFRTFFQFLVILHEGLLVVFFVGKVEQEADLEWSLVPFLSLSAGVIIETEGVVAACFEYVIVPLVRVFAEQFFVYLDSFSVLSHVEIAVCQPHTVLDLNIDAALILQQCDGPDPIP